VVNRIRYIVCSIPRSGSGYLCSLLSQTGRAGMIPFDGNHGWEYLLPHRLTALGIKPGDDALEKLERAFAFGTSENGVQGFKVVWDHFGPVVARGLRRRGPGGGDELKAVLARDVRWIYLQRLDHIAQAISWARATQTGAWNVLAPRVEGAEQYNYLLIRYKLWSIGMQHRAWCRFFDELAVRPLALVYEDFAAAALETITRIGDYLGIPERLSPPSAETPIRKQRDGLNREWRSRFIEDERSAGRRVAALSRTPFLGSTWAALHRALVRPTPAPKL
jgi:LPS sulfotransferase NodH